MARKNRELEGIIIPISGDATELNEAIKKPHDECKKLSAELGKINNGLKFDPSNIELLTQKSTVLGEAIASSSEKLRILKEHQQSVQEQAARGDLGEEKLRAYNRELEKEQDILNRTKMRLKEHGKTIEKVGDSTDGAARDSQKFQQATEAQKKAIEKATESNKEHGKATRNLKDDYGEAEKGALSFSDVVKASAIGNIIASGVKEAAVALWDFIKTGAESAKEFETNQTKLEHIMRNTINATDGQIDSIKDLIRQQEEYGVVSQNTQTAAAQEIATYTTKQKSLERLIPVMNDMVAQQYGVNASAQSGVTVATALGKTLDGQVGSLTRWGYRFTAAQQEILKSNNELAKLDVIAQVVGDSIGGLSEQLRVGSREGQNFGQSLQLEAVKRQFGQNVEDIKRSLLSSMLPALTTTMETISKFVAENGETLENWGAIIGTILEALAKLLQIIGQIPAPLLLMVGGIILAITTFSSATKGVGTLSVALGTAGNAMGMTKLQVIALAAAISLLLYLILALKEGSDKAASAINQMGNAAGSAANGAGAPRGYAGGTRSAARGWAWTGEDGPELVYFNGGEQVFTAAQSARMARQAGTQAIAGGGVAKYYDNSSLTVNTNDAGVMAEVADWWNNKQRRARAAGFAN